jgi:hypothetical protein
MTIEQLFENAARGAGAEIITGNGQFRVGKGEIVTDWCNTAHEAWRRWCAAAGVLRHCGFDVTSFDEPAIWQGICDQFGMTLTGRGRYGYFVWTGPGIEVMTGCNPLTGEYHNRDRRDDDPGFASYIGASGEVEPVEEFYKIVHHIGDWKEADPTRRSYC